MRSACLLPAALLLAALGACNPRSVPETATDAPERTAAAVPVDDGCAERVPASYPLPNVSPEHTRVAWWLSHLAANADLDEVLLDAAAIARHNVATRGPRAGMASLDGAVDRDALLAELQERLGFVADQLDAASYVQADGTPLVDHGLRQLDAASRLRPAPEVRLASAFVQFACVPLAVPLYSPSLDLRFDRNHCSGARAHEPVEVLAEWPTGWWLVRTAYTLGFVPTTAPLTRPLTSEQVAWLAASSVASTSTPVRVETSAGTVALEQNALVRVSSDTRALLALGEEVVPGVPLGDVPGVVPLRPLTRRNVLEAAFSFLDGPYGWGDDRGGRDCSRFILDLFATFGIELPRFSGDQARAGSFVIPLQDVAAPGERMLLIEAAARRGIVLLHFPGHIMLYLGRNEHGQPMAIHSFAEYLEPCASGEGFQGQPETLREVDRVAVSDLSLGDGTTRRSMLDRITMITVLGADPGPGLRGSALLREAAPIEIPAQCPDALPYTLFHSPRLPSSEGPLRVMLTGREPPGPATVRLRDPAGQLHTPSVRVLGGPPFTFFVQVDAPVAGEWQVVLGDGDHLSGCGSVRVRSRAEASDTGAAGGPVWSLRGAWTPAYEALWSAFIERLFDYPIDQDLTWTNLHDILRDPERNLLFNHLGQDEEDALQLSPDCADLAYFLRAYFAWKTGLPYGYRECSRGRPGRPPTCGDLITNLSTRESMDDVAAFGTFLNRRVRNGVHSASGRTAPENDETDVYPVALERTSLSPGTVYADPYGHIMTLTRWVDQTQTGYGVLMAADAQPDATVGRRRFWRGTFLFTPETHSVGAGFKAWRPLVLDSDTQTLRALTNDELRSSSRHTPFSTHQYTLSEDGFYDTMDALINPRPLEPWVMQTALIDALAETVVRRVNSVETGEAWMRDNGYPTVEMPEGAAIFQTTGPWEDYSTPSRDLRLLVAIDAMLAFVGTVERMPERFGIEALTDAERTAYIDELRRRRDDALAQHTFVYQRTDRSEWTLSLADVVARQVDFEMAYNPNDCPELRWGAALGTEEAATCQRQRPAFQEPAMARYREWFSERRRP